jgi:hypothetical protein
LHLQFVTARWTRPAAVFVGFIWIVHVDAQHHIAACMNTDTETAATPAHHRLDRNLVAGLCNGMSECKHVATAFCVHC